MSSRLEILLQYYKEEPHDPFNVYALAMEYISSDTGKALSLFEELLSQHEQYVPTYYHAAKLYTELNEREKAISTFEKGIAIAKKMNDNKAARELKSAYDEFMFE